MNAAFDSTGAPKTLYVGNLAHQCTEDLVMVLFNQIGPVKVRKRIYFSNLRSRSLVIDFVCVELTFSYYVLFRDAKLSGTLAPIHIVLSSSNIIRLPAPH